MENEQKLDWPLCNVDTAALIKFQLQYEKERFLPVEPQKEKKPDDSLESTFYAFLKERQFSRKGLAFQLDGMKRALVLIGRKSISRNMSLSKAPLFFAVPDYGEAQGYFL